MSIVAAELGLSVLPPQKTVTAMTESSRAVEQVRASLVIAKQFPRDEIEAEQRILRSCQRYSLAKVSIYKYPRGNQSISGPSIRLAEEVARNWGNLDAAVRELEQRDGESLVEAYCHDLETNFRKSYQWTVKHEIATKNGTKKLTDPRDIYEKIANEGARRLRACILAVIPADITEKAVKQCQKTLEIGDKAIPLIDRIRNMVTAFNELSVTKEMLESRLDHPIENMTAAQLVDFLSIFTSLKDNQSKREDWFDFKNEKPTATANEVLGLK